MNYYIRLIRFLRWKILSIRSNFIENYKISSSLSSMKISISNAHELQRGITFLTKEPDTVEWIESYKNSGASLIDVGANIGIYSLYYASLSIDSKVYCLEPDASSYVSLIKNISINNFKNINARLIAASNENGWLDIDLSTYEAGAGAGSIDGSYDFSKLDSSYGVTQPVFSQTLDSMTKDIDMTNGVILKIDVDGHELSILQGSKEFLKNKLLRSVIIELNTKSDAEISNVLSLFEECGMSLVGKGCWEQKWEEFTIANYLFARGDDLKILKNLTNFG